MGVSAFVPRTNRKGVTVQSVAKARSGQQRSEASTKMVEEDHYCLDILPQLSVIISSTCASILLVLVDHIHGYGMPIASSRSPYLWRRNPSGGAMTRDAH